jgi:hypothetical protein
LLFAPSSFAPKIDGVATRTGKGELCLLWRVSYFGKRLVVDVVAASLLLPTKGHSLHIINSERDKPLNGVPCTKLPGLRSKVYPQHSVTQPSPAVFSVLASMRPHVVHLWDENIINLFLQPICTLLGIPTVWSHHTRIDIVAEHYWPEMAAIGLHSLLLKFLQRYVGSLADQHLVVGQVRGCQCWPRFVRVKR